MARSLVEIGYYHLVPTYLGTLPHLRVSQLGKALSNVGEEEENWRETRGDLLVSANVVRLMVLTGFLDGGEVELCVFASCLSLVKYSIPTVYTVGSSIWRDMTTYLPSVTDWDYSFSKILGW